MAVLVMLTDRSRETICKETRLFSSYIAPLQGLEL